MANQLPVIRVSIHEGDDEISIRATNQDMVGWDLERSRRRWPAGAEAPFLMTSFLAWHALRRTRQLPADVETVEKFIDTAYAVTADEVETVDPSPSAATAG